MFPLAACAHMPPAPGPIASIGGTALIDGITVRPTRVLEDSRCPARVQCTWSGRLRIEAVIEYKGGSEELRREMTLGEAVSLPEGELVLAAVQPAAVAGKALRSSAYRFAFALRR